MTRASYPGVTIFAAALGVMFGSAALAGPVETGKPLEVIRPSHDETKDRDAALDQLRKGLGVPKQNPYVDWQSDPDEAKRRLGVSFHDPKRAPGGLSWPAGRARHNPLASIYLRSAPEPVRVLRVTKAAQTLTISISPGTSSGESRRWVVADGDPTGMQAAAAEITELVDKSESVVHEGDSVDQVAEWFKWNRAAYVRKSDRSANVSKKDIEAAALLGSRILDPHKTKVYNALPRETSLWGSLRELSSMNLRWWSQTGAWREVNEQVDQTARSLAYQVAPVSKRELLEEFAGGNTDVVIVVAHSDDSVTHLPGLEGETISSEDIDAIHRDNQPGRVIILITCKGGTVNGEKPSLGEALLKNRVASAVFASPEPVDANDVPGLIRELSSGHTTIRDALTEGKFIQIVQAFEAVNFGG